MKQWIQGWLIAMATYSRIPVPQVTWDSRSMQYSLCFLPWIGVIIGATLWFWQKVCLFGSIGAILFAAVGTSLPIWITGGIHMDGFCDTIDGRASHQTKERKLEILHDPHMGAFACIYAILYILCMFALLYELAERSQLAVLCVGFVLSRGLSAMAAVTLPAARKEGMLVSFSHAADRPIVIAILCIWIVLAMGLMLWLDVRCGALAVLAAVGVFVYYRRMAIQEFGGITGDLAGWFLQVCELFLVIAVFVGGL